MPGNAVITYAEVGFKNVLKALETHLWRGIVSRI